MAPAMTSNRGRFSIAALRRTVSNARKEISSRAAGVHQQQAKICSQNSPGELATVVQFSQVPSVIREGRTEVGLTDPKPRQ
jgi:hypothetical protein